VVTLPCLQALCPCTRLPPLSSWQDPDIQKARKAIEGAAAAVLRQYKNGELLNSKERTFADALKEQLGYLGLKVGVEVPTGYKKTNPDRCDVIVYRIAEDASMELKKALMSWPKGVFCLELKAVDAMSPAAWKDAVEQALNYPKKEEKKQVHVASAALIWFPTKGKDAVVMTQWFVPSDWAVPDVGPLV
jgi:hypothetical protein